MREIVNRRAFLEKFGIAADVEWHLCVLLQHAANQFCRPDWHRRLGDDDDFLLGTLRHRFDGRQHVAQVRRTVFVRRRTNGNEHELRAPHSRRNIGREREPLGTLIALDNHIQPGFEDRQHIPLKSLDLSRVEIGAHHVVTGVGKTCAEHQANVPRADHRNFHLTERRRRLATRCQRD